MTGPRIIDDDPAASVETFPDDERPSLLDLATDEGGRMLPGRRSKVTMADGSSFVVRITNREFVAYDMTRAKRKWPALSDAPFLGAAFLAHRAALREGLTDLTWDAWLEAVELLENIDEDESDEARPTR